MRGDPGQRAGAADPRPVRAQGRGDENPGQENRSEGRTCEKDGRENRYEENWREETPGQENHREKSRDEKPRGKKISDAENRVTVDTNPASQRYARHMSARLTIAQAIAALRNGGVIAYPTEAVWGLGCDPFDAAAVRRLLRIKQRDVAKGLILIASSLSQIAPLIDTDPLPPERLQAVLSTWPGPHTWLMPCTPGVPAWLRGMHATLALRVTAHPTVIALCDAFGGPIVSTSANLAGHEPARDADALDPMLLEQIDGVLEGGIGDLAGPTPIRDAASGTELRG
jgi:L-threonylcarbamoyladenylate synthase